MSIDARIAELIGARVDIATHEAVAFVQDVIDGSAVELSVDAAGALLDQLLPPTGASVPGALRYAIARARRQVDAPPFTTVQEFSSALHRFEPADREAVVHRLMERVHCGPPAAVESFSKSAPVVARTPDPVERRRRDPWPGELRRQFQDARARLTVDAIRLDPPPPVPEALPSRRGLVAAVVAILLAFVVGYIAVKHVPRRPVPARVTDAETAVPQRPSLTRATTDR